MSVSDVVGAWNNLFKKVNFNKETASKEGDSKPEEKLDAEEIALAKSIFKESGWEEREFGNLDNILTVNMTENQFEDFLDGIVGHKEYEKILRGVHEKYIQRIYKLDFEKNPELKMEDNEAIYTYETRIRDWYILNRMKESGWQTVEPSEEAPKKPGFGLNDSNPNHMKYREGEE